MTDEMMESYQDELCTLPPALVYVAARKCVGIWSKPGLMPPPAFIVDLTRQYRDSLKQELEAASKLGKSEAAEFLRQLPSEKQSTPVDDSTPEERRAHSREIIAAIQETYREAAEANIAQHRQGRVPEDPEERRKWATEKAKEMEWSN